MAVNVSSTCLFWKNFDLPKLQRSLDQSATDIATRQDESDISRKKLIEQSKLFKKTSSEEVRKAAAPLFKSFQTEIDSLTKRSKACETEYLTLYKKLIELPDPVTALDQAESYQRKNQRLNDIETENQKLRETLAEYNKEFAEVKNQEVTIKNLRERIKDLERNAANKTQRVIEEKYEELHKQFAEKEKILQDTQAAAAVKLNDAAQKAHTLQAALDACQSELFNLKSKYDEETAAKQAEVDIILLDLERANQNAESASKEVETLRDQLNDNLDSTKNAPYTYSNLDQSIDIVSKSNLENELIIKEKEVSQLVEDVQHLQMSMTKLRESTASSIAKLEQELDEKNEKCDALLMELSRQSDYAEVKKELSILKSTEFPSGGKEAKSIEMLLLEKNRALQTENTNLRASSYQLKELCDTLEVKATSSEKSAQEKQVLIEKLETDLMLVQSPAAVVRSAADGSPAPVRGMSEDLVADAVKHTSGSETTSESLLLIVSSQRERFRLRNNELEAENYTHQQTIQRLQTETDTIRADNVKLYEKIKYLQSYPASSTTRIPMEDVTANRYSSQYEENLDPFTSFNRKEKQRKYMNLSPPEKITLSLSRMILSSKLARTVFFFYMLFMHCMLYVILYKYAYTDDCKRHLADLCFEKFGSQMVPNQPKQ